jgi:hypothetical protein
MKKYNYPIDESNPRRASHKAVIIVLMQEVDLLKTRYIRDQKPSIKDCV